jgi:hypothetical protein
VPSDSASTWLVPAYEKFSGPLPLAVMLTWVI